MTSRRADLPDAVVFDHDGTLIDTETAEFEAARRVWNDYGLDYSVERWAHVVGTVDEDPWIAELEAEVGPLDRDEIYRRNRAYNADLLAVTPARDGIPELLDALSAAGVRLAVASNAPSWWVERRVGAVGLLHHFGHILGRDTASAYKPHPAPFLEACAAVGADPQRSVAVEDSAPGVASAVAAGLFTIACPGPLTLGHDLSGAHLHVVSHREITLDVLAAGVAQDRPSLR